MATIRMTGEHYLGSDKHKTSLIRINLEDTNDNAISPSLANVVSEKNVESWEEVKETPVEFAANFDKIQKEEEDYSIMQRSMLINMKTGGLKGIQLIYDNIKKLIPF